MCHELRNPLHVLKSSMQVLLEDAGSRPSVFDAAAADADAAHNAELTEVAFDALAAVDRMEGTVNDVLDFRKLDAGMFVLNRKPTALSPLIDSVCRHCRPFMRPDVHFGYSVTPADAELMLDPRRVFQVRVVPSNGMAGVAVTRSLVPRMVARCCCAVSGSAVLTVVVTGGPVPSTWPLRMLVCANSHHCRRWLLPRGW